MLDPIQWRKDCLADTNGRTKVIWAWKLPDTGLPYNEGMLILYNLKPIGDEVPELHAAGMTHEFQVLEIDPATPWDIDKSLFEQKEVSPLLPACVAYQFKAASESGAVARMQDAVDRVISLELPPDLPCEWAPLFRDAVEIGSHDLKPENIEYREAWMQTRKGEAQPLAREFQRRYQIEPATSRRSKTIVGLALGLAGALLIGGAEALAFGPDIDGLADWVHDIRGDQFYHEAEFPDGKVYGYVIEKVKGRPHRYKIIKAFEKPIIETSGG